MREFFFELWDIFKRFIYFLMHFRNSIINLKENSLISIRYFIEFGELVKAKIRLKTLLYLWSKNNEAKYLLAFVYTITNEKEMALYYFTQLENDELYSTISKKFISFIKMNKGQLIINEYLKKLSISDVENYVKKNSNNI